MREITKRELVKILERNPEEVANDWLIPYPDLIKKYKPELLVTRKQVEEKAKELARRLKQVL